VHHVQPDLILLDVMMPGVDGYEVCERLKFNETTSHIPVLFLSGIDDSPNKVKAFELGGVDYVTKPFQIEEVLARIEYQLKLYQLQKQQKATIEAEQPYKDFFENAIEGMFQTTVSGQFLRVNQALASLLGYDSPEDLMTSVRDLSLHLYTIPQRRSQFILYLEQFGKVKDFEVEVYRKNGDRIWIKETARAVRDSEGNLKYYEGTIQDITLDKIHQNEIEGNQLKDHFEDHYKRSSK
jgi:adenylate cyclase